MNALFPVTQTVRFSDVSSYLSRFRTLPRLFSISYPT